MANKVEITISNHDLNGVVANSDPVQHKLKSHAKQIRHLAETILAAHRDTGAHSIKNESHLNTQYGHVDWFVVMEGPAPVSVEFGHRAKNGRWVSGIYAITAGLSVRG